MFAAALSSELEGRVQSLRPVGELVGELRSVFEDVRALLEAKPVRIRGPIAEGWARIGRLAGALDGGVGTSRQEQRSGASLEMARHCAMHLAAEAATVHPAMAKQSAVAGGRNRGNCTWRVRHALLVVPCPRQHAAEVACVGASRPPSVGTEGDRARAHHHRDR